MTSRREIEAAITAELAHWPGVEFELIEGSKHPKVKLRFEGMNLSVSYSGTPSGHRYVHNALRDLRGACRKLGAARTSPDPTPEEDEAPYRKPNDGASKRTSQVGERAGPKPDVIDQLVGAGLVKQDRADIARAGKVLGVAIEDSVPVTGTDLHAVKVALGAPNLADDDETDDQAEARERREAIMAAAAEIVDGVYFGLPDTIYHAVPRLSASGLQKLCVSPATFWRGSWLDPDAPELDEEQTKAQMLGKAYHVARLEPDRFHETYCRQPAKEDYGPKLITSDTGIKAALKELGEPQTIGAESIIDRGNRLLECGHEGPVWAVIMDAFELERAGRIPIPGVYFDQITQDMERIRGNGEIAELLTGGQAEVSIFWTDTHGLKMKCRIDYLTPEWWDDFKTFDNSRGKVLDQALADAVRYNRYYVQATTYRDGVEALRVGGLDIVGEATEAQRDLVATIRLRPDELACWYVFQEKGGIPNLLAREFPFYDVPLGVTSSWDTGASEDAQAAGHDATRARTLLFNRAIWEINAAKQNFVLYSQAYDPGTPWFPLEARRRFSDLDFSNYWLEGKA